MYLSSINLNKSKFIHKHIPQFMDSFYAKKDDLV